MPARATGPVFAAFCIGIALGVAGSWAWAAQIHRIAQKDRAFAVKSIEIAHGDTIEFTNEDDFLHQIYVKSGRMNFDSDEQSPGETISVRFSESGTFDVRCHIHPTMLLVVTVR